MRRGSPPRRTEVWPKAQGPAVTTGLRRERGIGGTNQIPKTTRNQNRDRTTRRPRRDSAARMCDNASGRAISSLKPGNADVPQSRAPYRHAWRASWNRGARTHIPRDRNDQRQKQPTMRVGSSLVRAPPHARSSGFGRQSASPAAARRCRARGDRRYHASWALNALDRKRHLLYDALKEGQSAFCVPPWINADDLERLQSSIAVN
jgi:hypothetical protein